MARRGSISGQISLFLSAELQAVRAATKVLPAEVAKHLNRDVKDKALPLWQAEIDARTRTRQQAKAIQRTAAVQVGRANVNLQAARKGARLSGGARPQEVWAGIEFGARRRKNFGPRVPAGKVIWPSLKPAAARIAEVWRGTVADVVAQVMGKG